MAPLGDIARARRLRVTIAGITFEMTLFAFVKRNCSSIRRNAYDITMVQAAPDVLTQWRPERVHQPPAFGPERGGTSAATRICANGPQLRMLPDSRPS